MLKLRLLTGPRAGRQLRVSDTKPVSIGRRKGRLRLHDSRVSKNHAEIYFANDVWILKDLGSANGTYVNRKKVTGLVELEPGDLVQMGRVLLKIVRCDMIGMDTQPFDMEHSEDAGLHAPGIGVAEPDGLDGDFDLDQFFSDSESEDAKDGSFAGEVVEASPASFDEAAQIEPPVDEGPEELIPEPMSIAFEEEVNDDDSFFSDLGEATDTSDGKDIGIEEDVSLPELNEVDVEPVDIEGPLKLEGGDSSGVEIEVQSAGEVERDPFLPDGPEEEPDDDNDLISLADESGMGPRSHGTTLLTTAHDDGTPIDETDASDALPLDEDREVEEGEEPPALVGLSLEHAPPQQPQLPDEQEVDAAEAEQEVELEHIEDVDDAGQDVGGEGATPIEDPVTQALDEPESLVEAFELEPEPEAEPPQPEMSEGPAVPSIALDKEPVSQDAEAAEEFDIDAAFDELSEGLDDSLSGLPAVQEPDEQGVGTDEAMSAPEQEPIEPAGEEVDPLIGSQLDVSFIKDALSKMEDESSEPEAEPDVEVPEHEAAIAEVVTTEIEPAPPSDASALQSPPPGLSATGVNPTSLNPPEEPRRSYAPKAHGGIGRWFFMLLLLCMTGVGGWLLNENYDMLIGSRTADTSEDGETPPPDTTNPAEDSLVDVQDEPAPPDAPPVVSNPIEEAHTKERTGPDPFSAGPTVIGSEAVAGLTGSGSDPRALDPPQTQSTGSGASPDIIRDPSQPSVDPSNPGINNPADRPGRIEQVPTIPAASDEDPARIVFLVDASGSLVDSLPQMLVWLNQALQTVEQDEHFAIYFFKSGRPIAIKPEGMLKPSRNLLGQIREDWLNANRMPVFPSGRSDPTEAIAQALTLKPTDVYLLSDDAFAFHQGDTTSQEAIALVKQAIGDSKVRVHGVQFFYKSEQSILEALADQYDGTFEFVRDSVVPDEDPIDLLEELGNE